MSLKNYQCKKCRTVVQKDTHPNSSGCPKGSSHNWVTLGEVGNVTYQCKKCGTTIQGKNHPTASNCPEGSSHDWRKL